MSYHRPMGDYYPGDAQGDWASVWSGVKEAAKVIGGGIIGGWAQSLTGQAPPPPAMVGYKPAVGLGPQAPPGGYGGALTFPGGTSISGYLPPRVPGRGRLPPFTATGPGVLPGGGITGTGCPTGYHLDKTFGVKCVRNRRMNIANPRALRRAMRRVQGFEKLARRTITFTRRVKMKRRKS
jgi:hypothetical protein